MAQAKTEAFDPALVRTAGLAKALSHPVRIRILEILAARRGCICGGLVELLPLAQSTVSQHLRELRDAGLIRGEIDGPRICYGLDAKAVTESWASFKDMFRRICEPLEEGTGPRRPEPCARTSRPASRQPHRRPSRVERREKILTTKEKP
jgi:ArsR family transcriptional regulator, arsenate/arsenite/antimonite-responsive transcriptional repressor